MALSRAVSFQCQDCGFLQPGPRSRTLAYDVVCDREWASIDARRWPATDRRPGPEAPAKIAGRELVGRAAFVQANHARHGAVADPKGRLGPYDKQQGDNYDGRHGSRAPPRAEDECD